MRNLIGSPTHATARDRLHDRLLDWMNRTRDPFRGWCWERRPWRADARLATWMYTGMTRQRENEEYEPRQLYFAAMSYAQENESRIPPRAVPLAPTYYTVWPAYLFRVARLSFAVSWVFGNHHHHHTGLAWLIGNSERKNLQNLRQHNNQKFEPLLLSFYKGLHVGSARRNQWRRSRERVV